MSTTPLLPLPDGLDITSISETPDALLVRVTSHRPSSVCPLCRESSHAIHSYYRRKPMDLPCAGRPIRLLLTVKKFFCRETTCPRKIFTERLPELIEASSRLTIRLRQAVQEIGFATSGKGGEDLCPKLGIRISDVTLLWSLHLVPTPAFGKVRVVGLDDWSWKRGQRYGTIVVNLFLRVFVKRQFSLFGLASEGCWCLSVLNSHVIRCGQALCFWLTLRSMFLFLQG